MEKDKNKLKKVLLPADLADCYDLTPFLDNKEKDRSICDISIRGAALQSADLSDLCFENVLFSHCNFSEADLTRCAFTNVLFENCALANCNFSKSRMHRCGLKNAQFKGANFTNSRISHLCIENSNLRYANFSESQLEMCEIVGSDLTDAFFAGCTFKQLTVSQSQFVRTEFFRTSLKGIDFTTCTLDGICVSEAGKELSGAIVNIFQAAELSKLLGVIIKPD